MGTTTMKMSDWLETAREFPTAAEAEAYRQRNGIQIEGEKSMTRSDYGELPPVAEQAGALDAAAAADEADAAAEDQAAAADDAAAGALDFANLDFSKLRADPTVFQQLLQANYAANQRAEQSAKQLYEEGRKRIMEKYAGPTASERLFALSRAMLSPTKVPGFAGLLGNVTGALSENAKAAREAEQAREEQLFNLQQQYAQGTATRAAALPKTAADLAAKYLTATKPVLPRVVGTPVIGNKVVTVTQDPNSGKIETTELGPAPAGLKPLPNTFSGGQPVFINAEGKTVFADNTPVTQFDVKAKPVSATEQKQIWETEDALGTRVGTVSSLEEALSLNSQAYEGSLSGWRKTLGGIFSSDDPRYVATENFDNIVQSSGLRDLKTMFGANPTEGERKIYLELQAISSKPRAVREDILRRAIAAQKASIARETQRLERLKSGEYSTRGGSTAGEGRVIRFDRTGKRI